MFSSLLPLHLSLSNSRDVPSLVQSSSSSVCCGLFSLGFVFTCSTSVGHFSRALLSSPTPPQINVFKVSLTAYTSPTELTMTRFSVLSEVTLLCASSE